MLLCILSHLNEPIDQNTSFWSFGMGSLMFPNNANYFTQHPDHKVYLGYYFKNTKQNASYKASQNQ